MNITFLIGNGFDRNLGLKTTYSDFLNEYKNLETDDDDIRKFRQHIRANEELWAYAELELGQYTGELSVGEAARFSKCHGDICNHLANYLKKQEQRISYSSNETAIVGAFKAINDLANPFPTQEREIINQIYQQFREGQIVFRFICFNYTPTLRRCLDIVKQTKQALGNHSGKTISYAHSIGSVIYVHGTVDGEMVFGVNDETQIRKPDVFECEDGDIYKAAFIKKDANASYQENTDEKAEKILKESHLIYIYGMSIGDTDKLWWDRVCRWMSESSSRHVIVHKYELPPKDALSVTYQIAERQYRRLLTSKSTLSEKQKSDIEKRIHVTSHNLFEKIQNIAAPTEEELIQFLENEWTKAGEQVKADAAEKQREEERQHEEEKAVALIKQLEETALAATVQ